MVAHGASDLVTPVFRQQLILDQLPVYGSADRLKLAVYGGGHMFYSRDASRRALRDDARAMFARRCSGSDFRLVRAFSLLACGGSPGASLRLDVRFLVSAST